MYIYPIINSRFISFCCLSLFASCSLIFKMKFLICTVFAILMAITVAHPPSSEHEHHHHHDEKHDDEKPITEASSETRTAATEARSVTSDDDTSTLPVTIYYEGLCPDSRKLLTDLGRDYYLFKKYITLKFIPFGRAKSLDAEGNEFECHHGPKECLANRIHSCGIKYLKSQDAKQQFVVCQMRTEADQTGKEVRNTCALMPCHVFFLSFLFLSLVSL